MKLLDAGLVPDASYPSGHVATSLVCWAGTMILVWTYFRAARWLAVLLLVLPLFTLVSRLYLGAHHLTDALTSVVYGSVWLAVVALLVLPRGLNGRLVEHLAKRDPELDRLAGVRVLRAAAHETAVVAGEDHRLRPEPLGHGLSGAGRDRVARLLAHAEHDAGGCGLDGVEVVLVGGHRHRPLRQQRVVAPAVVLGRHPEHGRSGAGWAKYASVNSPGHMVRPMNVAMPAPTPLAW